MTRTPWTTMLPPGTIRLSNEDETPFERSHRLQPPPSADPNDPLVRISKGVAIRILTKTELVLLAQSIQFWPRHGRLRRHLRCFNYPNQSLGTDGT